MKAAVLVLITILFALSSSGQDANSGSGGSNLSARPTPIVCPVHPPAPTYDTTCYSGSGCIDVTFGTSGKAAFDIVPGSEIAKATLIQADGKIVMVGGTDGDFLVYRFNADGTADHTFGDIDPLNPLQRKAYTRTDFAGGNDSAYTALLQADGKIVAAGYASASLRWAVARYTTDGILDTTFDGDGKVMIFGGAAYDIAVQSDGKLVIAGDNTPSFNVARLNTNGTLDNTFGSGGIVTIGFSSGKKDARSTSVAIQRIPAVTGEERIVVAGRANVSSTTNIFALMRFTPNGSVDNSFGASGRVSTSILGADDQINSIAIDANNNIVAAGSAAPNFPGCNFTVWLDYAAARYFPNGTLDNSFSGDGKTTTDVYGGWDSTAQSQSLALQSDGKIVIAGTSRSYDASVKAFAVVRYNSDGSPDATFGPGFFGSGVITSNVDEGGAFSPAIQADGKIVVAGLDLPTGTVIRYLP